MNKREIIEYYNNSKKIIDKSSLTNSYNQWLDLELKEMDAGLSNNCNILEIGVGSGRVLDYLDNGVRTFTAIDIADVSNLIKKYENREHIKILNMDAEDLNFEDNSFDCVIIAYNTIGLMLNPHIVLEECKRVLKEDGIILVSTYGLDAKYCLDERIKCFKEIGHEVVVSEFQLNISNGVASYYFQKEELIDLFSKSNLNYECIPLTKLGCLWKLTKNI